MRFGGHRSAAGVTIAADRVGEFAARFNEVALAQLTEDDLVPELRVDLELPLDRSDRRARVAAAASGAVRHRESVAAARHARRHRRRAAARHRQGRAQARCCIDGGRELVALGWGMAPRARELDVGTTIDVAYRLERDEWQGESRLQARLADFRA